MNRFIISVLSLLISFNGFSSSDEDELFLRIVDSEWQRSIDENPLYASYMGDKSSNQDWPDLTEETLRIRQKKTRDVLEKIKNIDSQKLSEEKRGIY